MADDALTQALRSSQVRGEVSLVAIKGFFLGLLTAVALSLIALSFVLERVWLCAVGVHVLVVYVVFHASEFLVAMRYRAHDAGAGAFMLYHSPQYAAAQVLTWCEFVLETFMIPERLKLSPQAHPLLGFVFRLNYGGIVVFALLTLLFYAVRVVAMVQCRGNFSLTVRTTRQPTHTLVQHGLYTYLRHPAYFGWFWRTVTTQLIIANPISFVVHTFVTWYFFHQVIPYEEHCLAAPDFFGEQYTSYLQRTIVGIPFIA